MMTFGLGRRDHMVTLGLGGVRVYGPSGILELVVCHPQKAALQASLSGVFGVTASYGHKTPPVDFTVSSAYVGLSGGASGETGVSASSAVLHSPKRRPPALFHYNSYVLAAATRGASVGFSISQAPASVSGVESFVWGARAEGSENGSCE